MIKIATYIDGPNIPNRTNVIKFAFVYDTDKFTPTSLDDYTFNSFSLVTLNTITGTPISVNIFLNNIDKFGYNAGLTYSGTALIANRRIAVLDSHIPMAFIRANTIVNFGRL